LLGGCQVVGKKRIIPCPLSFKDQTRQILKITPLKTSRDEVVEKLTAAGIEGAFGASHLQQDEVQKSIYYCDVWNRENGERWHVDVALLFDGSGLLYGTRQGEAKTGFEAGSGGEDQSEATATNDTTDSVEEESQPAEASSEEPRVSTRLRRRRGQGTRTPFREPEVKPLR